MKLLIIGGTGLISSACSDLAVQQGHDVFLLNRGLSSHYHPPLGSTLLKADIRGNEANVAQCLSNHIFDAVIDFCAFTEEHIERDIRLFRNKTKQFVFISSATVYQKPPAHYCITEETPLGNPFWQYAQDKIACEKRLLRAWNDENFPITIIRPSLTYGPSQIPILGASWLHPWTIIDRIQRHKKIIVPGDGTSLWTLTWNEDFAKGCIGLLGRIDSLGLAFHITSDEVLTWNMIVGELYAALGKEPDIVHIPTDLIIAYRPEERGSLLGDKVNSTVFDNTKIKHAVPDFSCNVTWAEGIRRAITWFEEDSSRRTIDEDMNDIWNRIIAGYERALPNF